MPKKKSPKQPARLHHISPRAKALLDIGTVSVVINALAIVAYRMGLEQAKPVIIVATIAMITAAMLVVPGMFLSILAGIFCLIIVTIPLFYLLFYLLTITPVLGVALRDGQTWAIVLAMVIIVVFSFCLWPTYMWLDSRVFRKFKKK